MPGIKSIYAVIKSPLTTEKTTRNSVYRQYSFWVDKGANKIEIKRAVEKIYNVKVAKVTSLVVKGKTKRMRMNQEGKTASWKKAVVRLKEGSEIKLT
jgi:large subunit ribosomal protein L23